MGKILEWSFIALVLVLAFLGLTFSTSIAQTVTTGPSGPNIQQPTSVNLAPFSGTPKIKIFSQELNAPGDEQKLEATVNKWLEDNGAKIKAFLAIVQSSASNRLDITVWYVPAD